MTNGFKYGGYKGQLLRVNLSKKGVAKEPLREDRRLFDAHRELDAVWVATPDHTHFPAAVRAMHAGAGVYCEKPLTYSIAEARQLRELAAEKKVATQMGNQGHSSEAIRILCEYEEPRQRLMRHRVHHTIVFFGSARCRAGDEAQRMLADATTALAAAPHDPVLALALRKAEIASRMSTYYDAARELTRRLTEWSTGRTNGRKFVIASGGGPGIMEAANHETSYNRYK